MRLDERIQRHYAELGPQERKAADTLLDRLGEIAVYNAAELAALSGVSKATMSRLFRRLGYADFGEVKEHIRNIRASGVPVAPHGSAGGLDGHLEHEGENLRRVADLLGTPQLRDVTGVLASARQVLVIGYRNSFPVALHLRQQLLQCRGNVGIAPQPGQTVGEELAGIGAGDAVILVGFRRRPAGFAKLLEAAASSGATTVLIADSSARKHSRHAATWLECPVDGVSAFDSYAAAMSLASILANEVLQARSRAGRERVREATGLFDTLGEIEP